MLLTEYLPIFIFILLGVGFGVLPMLFGRILSPHKPYKAKLSPYECGFEAFEDARMKFDIRFYLLAILFIVFDLEIAFLFPWAVALNELSGEAYIAMAVFMVELIIGFIYIWVRRGLEWQ
jgi:NADH-quinone oxidoreductase subunit A